MTMISGRATTPEQKQQVVAHVLSVWLDYPDLRLGQLLNNALGHNIFFLEDGTLVNQLEFWAYEEK